MKHARLVLALLGATTLAVPAFAGDWFPYPAEEVTPAFSTDGTAAPISYEALPKADKPWNICVAFPHMKDAYWLGVDYGVTEEAKRQGVKLNVVEAGGYTELAKQISQIEVRFEPEPPASTTFTAFSGRVFDLFEFGIQKRGARPMMRDGSLVRSP